MSFEEERKRKGGGREGGKEREREEEGERDRRREGGREGGRKEGREGGTRRVMWEWEQLTNLTNLIVQSLK